MKLDKATRVVLLAAVLAFFTLPALAQGDVYTYRFYNADDKVIAGYIGPLITGDLCYNYTSGFSLNVGAVTWASNSGAPQPSVPGSLLQPCFFVMSFAGDPPAYNFACRVLQADGQPQGTEIELDFIGPLPTSPGNYYWPDQVIGSHLKYFDGTSDWYAFSTTTGHEITRVEIVAGTLSTYSCAGFAEPFAAPISLKKRIQRVIPLKAQLLEAGGQLVTDTSIAGAVTPIVEVTFSGIGGDGVDVTNELLSPGQASSGNSFSFDLETNTWQFNLATGLFTAPGTYTVMLKSGNTERYQVKPTCTGTFVRQ